jgi:cell division protein FtsX
MQFIIIPFIILATIFPMLTLGGLINTKALSPSSNVHVDVVNHVASSLYSHSQQFQSTWRDYSIVFLLVLVLGGYTLLCCGVIVVCLYRRLLFQVLRRSPTQQTIPKPGSDSAYHIT